MNELQTIKRKILLKEQALFLIDIEEEKERSKIHADIDNLWQQYQRCYKQQCLIQIADAMIINSISKLDHCDHISENHGA